MHSRLFQLIIINTNSFSTYVINFPFKLNLIRLNLIVYDKSNYKYLIKSASK